MTENSFQGVSNEVTSSCYSHELLSLQLGASLMSKAVSLTVTAQCLTLSHLPSIPHQYSSLVSASANTRSFDRLSMILTFQHSQSPPSPWSWLPRLLHLNSLIWVSLYFSLLIWRDLLRRLTFERFTFRRQLPMLVMEWFAVLGMFDWRMLRQYLTVAFTW